MFNLPTQLRAEAEEWDDPMCSEHVCVDLMRRAADEIERLRKIEKAARNLLRDHGFGDENWRALEGATNV